jgi:hypothetical protein
MPDHKEHQLATIHRLRPRSEASCTAALRTSKPQAPRATNLIDLARARALRGELPSFDPPEGTAA